MRERIVKGCMQSAETAFNSRKMSMQKSNCNHVLTERGYLKWTLMELRAIRESALEQEGYVEVLFDKPVETYGKRFKLYFFARGSPRCNFYIA